MPKEIGIFTDYVCPYCLLAETIIQDVIRESDVSIRWHPFELRPDPVPTLRVEDPYLPDVWRRSVYPLAERLGVPIGLPRISPQPRTDKAFEVFAMAEEQGLGHEWSLRVMKAFFQEEQDIGNCQVLCRLATEVGLDPHDVLKALLDGSYRDVHREAHAYATAVVGVRVVPTILIGAERIEGVPTPDRIRTALEKLEQASHGAEAVK